MKLRSIQFGFTASLVLMLTAQGCGSKYNSSTTVKPAEVPVVKMIQSVAETGELGSGAMAIEDELEKLKKSDQAKAKILEEGLKRLKEAEGQEDQIKAIAGELVINLNK